MSSEFSNKPQPPILNVETEVSRFDSINAMLIASVGIFGLLAAILFMIWLTTAFDFSIQKIPLVLIPVGESGDGKPLGELDDFLEPGVEEFPDVDEPQLAMALEAVTDSVSSVNGVLAERSGSSSQMGKGRGFGSREGGPGNGGGGVPEHKRWIIQYESDSIDTYAKQLSHFNIDIGVVDNLPNKIVRIHDPGGSVTVIQSTRESEAKTLRFIHKKPSLQRWDKTLATRQNVSLEDATTCQFYPELTRQKIRLVEALALQAAGKTLIEVRNTTLKVEPEGDGFVFKVVDILYR